MGLGSVLGTTARGAVAIGVEYEHHPKDYRTLDTFKIVKVTDLAITAKLSPDGSLVWVTRFVVGRAGGKGHGAYLGLAWRGARVPNRRARHRSDPRYGFQAEARRSRHGMTSTRYSS